MNAELLSASIVHHGRPLLDSLQEEQVNVGFLGDSLHSVADVNSPKSHPCDDTFKKKLVGFISRKADLLFDSSLTKVTSSRSLPLTQEDHYAVLPAIEYFMNVPAGLCKNHFYESLERDTLLVCVVTSVSDEGLGLTVLTTHSPPIRWVGHLKISAHCSVRDVESAESVEDPLDGFTSKDLVRVFVKNMSSSHDRVLSVSMRRRLMSVALPANVKLGLISDEDLPTHYRVEKAATQGISSYNSLLEETLAFNNPRCVSNLISKLIGSAFDQSQPPSLMRGLARVVYSEEEFSDKLRKAQTHRLAMKSVEKGVIDLREGRQIEAMQMFNKALQIDERNVEALVARGALYANNESYDRAMEDFEAALCIDSEHINARRYAIHTITTQATCLLETENIEKASECVERLALIDPNNSELNTLRKEVSEARQRQRRPRHKGSQNLSDRKVYSDDDDDEDTIERARKKLLKSLGRDETHSGGRKRKRDRSSSSSDDTQSLATSTQDVRSKIASILDRRVSASHSFDYRLVNPEKSAVRPAEEFGGSAKYYGPVLPPPPVLKMSERKKKKQNKKPSRKRRKKESSPSSSSSSDVEICKVEQGGSFNNNQPTAERKKSSSSLSRGREVRGQRWDSRGHKIKGQLRSDSRAREVKGQRRSGSRGRDVRSQSSSSNGSEFRGQRSGSRGREVKGRPGSGSRDCEVRDLLRSNSRSQQRSDGPGQKSDRQNNFRGDTGNGERNVDKANGRELDKGRYPSKRSSEISRVTDRETDRPSDKSKISIDRSRYTDREMNRKRDNSKISRERSRDTDRVRDNERDLRKSSRDVSRDTDRGMDRARENSNRYRDASRDRVKSREVREEKKEKKETLQDMESFLKQLKENKKTQDTVDTPAGKTKPKT